MKYTFETDDICEAKVLTNAPEVLSQLGELHSTVRNHLKHGDAEDPLEHMRVLEIVKSVLSDIIYRNEYE